jgi:hypothetical protein
MSANRDSIYLNSDIRADYKPVPVQIYTVPICTHLHPFAYHNQIKERDDDPRRRERSA